MINSKDNILLKEVIFEHIVLENKARVIKNITSTINNFKDILKKKNISCRINFLQPNKEKKYQDFGSLGITIDLSVGRSKNMTIKGLTNYIKKLAHKARILRFFNFVSPGLNSNILDFEFDLKNKYVFYYVGDEEEFPIDRNKIGNSQYYLPKEMKLL